MKILAKLKQRVKQYRSAEAKGKRKREKAEREANRMMSRAGKAILETRKLEIQSGLARARAKAELARAGELEARAKRKAAEKRLKREGLFGQMVRGLSSSPKRRRRKK